MKQMKILIKEEMKGYINGNLAIYHNLELIK